jgi:Fe-Mn family superoxide dismutase
MNQHYPFVNVPLPYDYDAMEPYIDTKTMLLHHNRHLQTYIDNLNSSLSNYPKFQEWSLDELLIHMPSLPKELQMSVMNNGGGVFNHRFYFSNLINPALSSPIGFLMEAITKKYGSYESFQKQFKAAALSVFGSGYAWLVMDATGQLKIITTKNQDTPLAIGMCPVLNIDVWEHAYYLKHYNVRADYIDDWFHVVNWVNANKHYMRCFGMAV